MKTTWMQMEKRKFCNKSVRSEKYDTDYDVNHEPLLVTGQLNDLLRKQLATQLSSNQIEPTDIQANVPDDKTYVSVIANMLSDTLDWEVVENGLNQLFEWQRDIYLNANLATNLRHRQFISKHGLVMSPEQCITTVLDTQRVSAFIRAVDLAIKDLRQRFSRTLHLVYPACGPFAPLLLPLIGYYREQGIYGENDLRVSLIDMQPGAIASLEALIHEMGISGYIQGLHCMDATEYQPGTEVHLVVLEAMQHGFSREGHLPIARHFAELLAPGGAFIPEEITLRAVLNNGQVEFCEQRKDRRECSQPTCMQEKYQKQRIELGNILTLTLETLRGLRHLDLDDNTRLIECGSVQIPEIEKDSDKQLLLICTHIRTYGCEQINEYASGITHPLPDMQVCINFVPLDPKPGDLLLHSGDSIKFYYRLNGLPGLMATKVES